MLLGDTGYVGVLLDVYVTLYIHHIGWAYVNTVECIQMVKGTASLVVLLHGTGAVAIQSTWENTTESRQFCG